MRRLAAALAIGVLALSGCASQIAGLAPVGGDTMTGVRTAVIDELISQGVDIKIAPTCAEVDTGYACQGMTLDGKAILATASDDDDPKISIVVGGGAPIFTGTMQAVLDEAAQATS